MKTDLEKLNKNKEFWSRTLPKRLCGWRLVVPEFEDKKLLTFLKKQAAHIRRLKLPFIGNNFLAEVKTDKDFPTAYAAILSTGANTIRILSDPVTEDLIYKIIGEKPNFVKNVDEKLKKARPEYPDAKRLEIRHEFLKWFLKSENILEKLHRDMPLLWAQVTESVQVEQQAVTTSGHFDDSSPSVRLINTRSDLHSKLLSRFAGLDGFTTTSISWGTIAQWLGECPLDF